MTNLLILYPDIPFDAVRTRATESFHEDYGFRNLISGERYQRANLASTSSFVQTIDFELASATSNSVSYLSFAEASNIQADIERVSVKGSSSSFFAPSEISGLQIWLAADREVWRDGSNKVYLWRDLSGNGNHVSAAGSARPDYKLPSTGNALNGFPSISFDGSNHRMTGTSTWWASISAMTMFVVQSPREATPVGTVIDASTTNAKPLCVYALGSFRTGVAAAGQAYTVAIPANGDTVIQTTVYDGSAVGDANRLKRYQSGVQDSLSFFSGVPATTSNGTGIVIGDDITAADKFLGHVCEVIGYNAALSDVDRQKVEEYLIAKWSRSAAINDGDFATATLYGSQSEDYINKFTASSAYRYWWLSYIPSALTSLKHSKAYFGNAFDMGVECDYAPERIAPSESISEFDAGTSRSSRMERTLYRFSCTWEGVTDAKVDEFWTKIARYRDQNRFFLYTQDQHAILDDQRLVHCRLVDCDVTKTGGIDDYNIVDATFEELP